MSEDSVGPVPATHLPPLPAQSVSPTPVRVIVVDFDISISNMTVLILKMIPALFLAAMVLACIGWAIARFISGFHQ